MPYKLTPQSRVTVPKSVQEHLKVELGGRIVFEPLVDGSVRIFAENGQVACGQHFKNPSPVGAPDGSAMKRPVDDGLVQYLLNSPKVDDFELPVRRSGRVPPVKGR